MSMGRTRRAEDEKLCQRHIENQRKGTYRSEQSTRKPFLLSLETSNLSIMMRALARRSSSGRSMPSGSYSTPLPSTTARVLSLEILISLEPRSPSGPPVYASSCAFLSKRPCEEKRGCTTPSNIAIQLPEESAGSGGHRRRNTSTRGQTHLDLGGCLLGDALLAEHAQHVLVHRPRGHAVQVVGDTCSLWCVTECYEVQ